MQRHCLDGSDQLLPQLLMEQFDTLHKQCRHIEHMHEELWFTKNYYWQNDSYENLDNFSVILNGFCICNDSALMGRSTPTTAFDGAIWYFVLTMYTYWTYAWRTLVHKKLLFTKWQLWELRQFFQVVLQRGYACSIIVHTRADQLLSQLLIEHFDT